MDNQLINTAWWIFHGDNTGGVEEGGRLPIDDLPAPPSWRDYKASANNVILRTPPPELSARGSTFQADVEVKELVNTAIYLRRPLLVTGKPGSGKSSLAYAIAYELGLGQVLSWPINSRSTLKEGLYEYDVLGRLYEADRRRRDREPPGPAAPAPATEQSAPSSPDAGAATEGRQLVAELGDITAFLRLGPLGTAMLPTARPRVLLIDEIDKSDVDLPNDLLNIFEQGEFEIPELRRLKTGDAPVMVRPADEQSDDDRVPIVRGIVRSYAFPIVVMTSNGEREFPPAFLRRCIRLRMSLPGDVAALNGIISAHFKDRSLESEAVVKDLLTQFMSRQQASTDSTGEGNLATDQLLNAIYLAVAKDGVNPMSRPRLLAAIMAALNSGDGL